MGWRQRTTDFFAAYLALPVVMAFWAGYKFWFRTKWVKIHEMDLVSGRNRFESEGVRRQWKEDEGEWPRWKKVYKMLC